uniref:Uncharacterized protein n=1 Tax=viral metagenome TaxID=1070528 RepID=A0A6M3ITQ1_9ZZZZ
MPISYGTRKALGRKYAIDPALMLESQRLESEYALAPGREARAIQAAQFETSMAFNREQAALNRQTQEEQIAAQERGGMVGTIGNTALTAGMIRAMTMKPGTSFWTGAPLSTTIGAPSAAYTAGMGAGTVGTGTATIGGTAPFATAVGPKFVVNPALMGAGEAGATGAGTVGASTAGAAPAATPGMGAYAGPAAAVAAIELGHQYVTKPLAQKAADALPGGRKEWGTVEKMGTRAAQGAVIGSAIAPGPGTVIGAGFGAAVGLAESVCIIVSACTDRNSIEVDITRQYRDKYLDADQLRGYYCLAEKIVPCLERNENLRKNVKKWLVDRLIDYGEYRLGLKEKRPRILSYLISKAFLGTIKTIGMMLPYYVRINGEIF